MTTARAYWAVAPGRGEIREHSLAHGRHRMLFSGISRGTERLVARGRVPKNQWSAMRCPHQEGDFPFPVKYGYQAVVSDGTNTYFALHPHQTHLDLADDALLALPAGLPPRRAVLAANMETALNALWDGAAGPGDRINVVGAGVVGLLIGYLASRLPGSEVCMVDPFDERRTIAHQLGAGFADRPLDGADLAFHTSATEAGLGSALGSLGTEGRLIEVSWYGDHTPAIALGEAFHAKRLHIQSSQVGMISAPRRPRWSHRRRLAKALELLRDPVLDCLIDCEIAFAQLPEHMADLASSDVPGLCTLVRYPDE